MATHAAVLGWVCPLPSAGRSLLAMTDAQHPVLVCFDDSPSAARAIAEVARLFPALPVIVLHVWRPLEATAAYRYSAAGVTRALEEQMRELDAAGQDMADEIAERGAELARAAGLEAEARAAAVEDEVPATVSAVADSVDACVVVMGSRGLGAIQAIALGGFSHGVLQHSRRPVLVVPSAQERVGDSPH
jgi:nucleotide-binding universal stress UspA family protein